MYVAAHVIETLHRQQGTAAAGTGDLGEFASAFCCPIRLSLGDGAITRTMRPRHDLDAPVEEYGRQSSAALGDRGDWVDR
jgi:hypothetical protein